eukprot:Skav217122  [mRNA]  locus=scaffold783:282755:286276:- [translate_table: standard]
MALCFHFVLTHVAATAFALMNADRDDLIKKQLPQKQEKLFRRRLRFKGAQALLDAEQPKIPGSTLTEVFANTAEVVDLLWTVLTSPGALTDSIFSVVVAFYPHGNSRSDMLKRMTEDIFKTLSGLKWRILYQNHAPPYKYLQCSAPDFDASNATIEFLAMRPCCLDPSWARPIQEQLQQFNDLEEQVSQFQKHIKTFTGNCRGVSSREENMHATQRVSAGGWKSKAKLFVRQAAECVLRASLENFTSRTGIAPNTAPPHIKAASQVVRTKKIIHKRPRQYGSAMFYFIAARKKENPQQTQEELRQEWTQLAPAIKLSWKTQHVAAVASRRMAKKHMEKQTADASNFQASSSPWGLGDSRHPLKEQHMVDFLEPFQRRSTGIEALGECKSPQAVQLHRAYTNNQKRYHSADTSVATAREILGSIIDENKTKEDNNTWKEVAECERKKPGCFEKHPGLCDTIHANKLSQVEALSRMIPKGNGILFLELGSRPARDRLAIFALVITGLKHHSGRTLRPKRQFFAILEPTNAPRRATPHVSRSPLHSFKVPDKFPFELTLVRARKDADIGNSGIFNHFEFFSHLLDISKNDVACWKIKSLDCVQQSLGLHTALAIAADHGAPKEPAKSSSSAKEPDDPWSFFDCAFLKPEKANHFKQQQRLDDDNISEFDFADADEDLCDLWAGTDLDTDKTKKRKHSAVDIPQDPLDKMLDAAGKDSAPHSDAESVQSTHSHGSGYKKTVATETALVKEALQEIGRQAFAPNMSLQEVKQFHIMIKC